eukprot:gnl/Dysnectes_brevis/6446_a10010_274.p1 GENE.gnl/Dysnectes_brevis/6446_a10010_274~~gnl/Dysnectes_brevis/6446_a10010_274.p1  ORF type:complete len:501 (-),score=128.89 gnl/Dysnectes_brevis/6446_a10010_274:26-1528(-)
MNSSFEDARRAIEEYQLLERGFLTINFEKRSTFGAKIAQSSSSRVILDEMDSRLSLIDSFFSDDIRTHELQYISGRSGHANQTSSTEAHPLASKPNPRRLDVQLSAFEQQLHTLRSTATDQEKEQLTDEAFPLLESIPGRIKALWTSEERGGRYFSILDNEIYQKWIQVRIGLKLKAPHPPQHLYVRNGMHRFQGTTEAERAGSSGYRSYMVSLRDSLLHFLSRRYPLTDHSVLLAAARARGSAAVRQALSARQAAGLYCQVCGLSVASAESMDVHLRGKKHRKMSKKAGTRGSEVQSPPPASKAGHLLFCGEISGEVEWITEQLHDTLEFTAQRLESRAGGGAAEDSEGEEVIESRLSTVSREGDGAARQREERKILNPTRLPIDPSTGQPMPLWLYKVNGLSVEHHCEICGGVSYRGRLQYERHFRGGQHARGLKALGIPTYTPHFFGITGIDQAVALHHKMLRSVSQFDPHDDVEVEDDEGHVMTRREYRRIHGDER